VVDAHLAAPQWCMLAPASGGSSLILAARRAAHGVDDVSDLLLEVAPGISLLPLAAEPHRWTEVGPAVIGSVLSAVAAVADLVVVDIGDDIRAPHPAYDVGWAHDTGAVGRAVMAAADALVAVLSAEPVGVHRFAAWWPVLCSTRYPDLVVANRLGAPRSGKRPHEQVGAILDALGSNAPLVHVPWNVRAADGLLQPQWWQSRGWGKVPEQLCSGMSGWLAAQQPVLSA
jgi:hypothetical protein